MDILDAYTTVPPSDQNAVDIFKGEWSSKFPAGSGLAADPGRAALFEDPRIDWLSQETGGFAGKRILELGPLEAGHTYMMHKGGADSITAVEANSRSYLKCLCVKEIFGLVHARFLYGDAFEYAGFCPETFDICVASGILYHMTRPVEFLRNICRTSDTLFLWTHYYDEARLRALGRPFDQFRAPTSIEVDGRSYAVARRDYQDATEWSGFCGGGEPFALWLTRDSLLDALGHMGFDVTATAFDTADHPNGPALALVAQKSKAS